MRARIRYVSRKLGDDDIWEKEEKLCFICATKKANETHKNLLQIYLDIYAGSISQCDYCRKFIEDQLDI